MCSERFYFLGVMEVAGVPSKFFTLRGGGKSIPLAFGEILPSVERRKEEHDRHAGDCTMVVCGRSMGPTLTDSSWFLGPQLKNQFCFFHHSLTN